MTKAAELAIIDRAIAELGRDSYLGPWLAGVRPQLEADIRNDLYPSVPTPAEALREAEAIVTRARAEADEIHARAVQGATADRDKAWADCTAIRRRCAADLERAAKVLIGG